VLYTQSSGYYFKCGVRYRAEPGVLVIVSPGQPHDFVSLRRSSVYSEITFSFATPAGKVLTLPFEKLLNLYTGVTGQLPAELHLTRDTTQELLVLLIQIMDYLQSPSAMSDFYAQRTLTQVFDLVAAHCFAEEIPGAPLGQNNPLLLARQYIDAHYAEDIAAADLAALCHCSKGHLFRTFKKAFQVSPLAYQQGLRFDAAQRLLRFTSLRCYEIAQRVGFANIYYFHRQFRKRVGMTPRQYRQSLR
jgi:AraC-like DNA-binding protein